MYRELFVLGSPKKSVRENKLIKTFVILVLLSIFLSHFVRYYFGFYIYLAVPVSVSVFICVPALIGFRKEAPGIYISGFCLVSLFVYSVLSLSGPRAMFYSSISLLSFCFAHWAVKQSKNNVLIAARVGIFVYYAFFIVSGLNYGFTPMDVNNYLSEGSRNIVSAVGLMSQLIYSSAYFNKYRVLPLITPIVTLIFSVLAFGRSGISLSFVVLMFSCFYNYSLLRTDRKMFWFVIFFINAAVFVFIFDTVSLVFNTGFDKGVESPRFAMISEYLFNVDLEAFLVGVDLSTVKSIASYGENPHNSFIRGHSGFGAIYLAFLAVGFVLIVHRLIVYKNTGVYFFLILVFLVRVALDSLAFLDVIDVVFYFLVFLMYQSSGGKRKSFIVRVEKSA